MSFSPTPEQLSIIEAGKSSNTSLMIEAMAGCAKTTTLELLAKALPVRPSLALAFNVKIKKELEKRFPQHFNVLTMNGLGHRAWSQAIGKRLTLEDKKIGKIFKDLLKEEKIKDLDTEEFVSVLQLVRKARSVGLVPEQYPNKGLLLDNADSWQDIGDLLYTDVSDMQMYLARRVLSESIRLSYSGVIDFDDQIYMSTLFGGVFPRYPLVMVDEAQDLSPLNHIQLKRVAADRLIVCGDPRQAIYAFRGADSSSMQTMRKLREEWVHLPLSTTFRCPKKAVARQQAHAPGFRAADTNASGEVLDFRSRQEAEPGWSIQEVVGELSTHQAQVSILCRNNAPILACALRIIRAGYGCTVIGGEIGKGMIALIKKICPDLSTSIEHAYELVARWADLEISKARANEKEERVAIIQDKRDCLLAVMDNADCKTVADICLTLERMFDSQNLRITLSSGHKAKGLEWDTVVHLDPWRIPSKFARRALDEGNPTPMEQDLNLRYVIETRTKHTLILANLEDMK